MIHTFVVYVDNKPGVLNRVSSLMRARNRPNIPMVVLPHPFEPLHKEEILKLAKDKLIEVTDALTKEKKP